MADVSIVIKENGVSAVVAHLEGDVDRSKNLSPVMKAGAQLMMGSINKNFRAGGRPGPWFPLAASTIKRKLRLGLSMTPLTGRTGMLRASISPSSDNTGFKLGTSIVYGKIHQFGGYAGRKHAAYIPARPYLVFQEQDLTDINGMVKKYIVGK